MGQEELLQMRIRSMLYKYQRQLLDCTDDEDPTKPVLDSVINDLIELSVLARSTNY